MAYLVVTEENSWRHPKETNLMRGIRARLPASRSGNRSDMARTGLRSDRARSRTEPA